MSSLVAAPMYIIDRLMHIDKIHRITGAPRAAAHVAAYGTRLVRPSSAPAAMSYRGWQRVQRTMTRVLSVST